MAASNTSNDIPLEGRSGRETSQYACNKCLQMILSRRFRCLRCSPAFDLCQACHGRSEHDASHEWTEFPPGFIDFDEVLKSSPIPFHIDVCLSVGHNLRAVVSIEEDSDSDEDAEAGDENREWTITFTDVLSGGGAVSKGEQTITSKQLPEILKALKIGATGEAAGRVIMTRFRAGDDLLTELVLAGRYGVYTTPCREHLENRITDAFRRGELPNFNDIHPFYVHDYWLSLFSPEFDFPDPVSNQWLDRMARALADSPYQLTQTEADAFENPPNEIQMILVRLAARTAKSGDACQLIAIFPASNGILSQPSTLK